MHEACRATPLAPLIAGTRFEQIFSYHADTVPLGAAALLRRSLLIYGVGGIVAPFVGIKLIDVVLAALGLV